jgi:beta-phosphoglucomutase-like phosphatase (HAD superfamily)
MEFNEQTPAMEQQNKGKVGEVAEQAQQKAKELASQAQEQAKSAAETRKEQAVEGLEGIAQAFRQTGQNLRTAEQGTVADYSEQVANQIERFSSFLSERNVDQLLGDAESYARSHPELFLGGAFALGLLVGRFIKSSGERRELVRAGYYHSSSYPPAPQPTRQGTLTNSWSEDVSNTQPSYRPQYNDPDFP